MSLWDVANPLRPDSIFSIMAPTYAHLHAPLPDNAIYDIPETLATVCGLGDLSTAENNPYLHAAHAVSQIQDLPDDQVTIGQTERFTRSIQGPFEYLLRGKYPAALLLLYLWYRKAGRCIWWIGLRARIECPSICAYLRLYHKGNSAVQAFLPGGPLADRWNQSRSESQLPDFSLFPECQ
ncbi:C6 finger domain-containing protein [Apiospora hydei]|uniref:C6 finger domain-containing protein n=1 Tax=Apiospora hydei TaxID=1337664 RepID=A0ABR1V475_9PEZI